MKKVLFILIVFVALVTNGCGSDNNTKPLEGADNLETFTIKGSKGEKLMGVKEKGENGTYVLSAMFSSVEAYAGFLFGKTFDDREAYRLFLFNGESQGDYNIKILMQADSYRIIQFQNGGDTKWIISLLHPSHMFVGEDAYIYNDIIFGKVGDKWDVAGVSPKGFDKVIVAKSDGNTCYIVGTIKPNKIMSWDVWIQKTPPPDRAKLLMCFIPDKVRAIAEAIEADLPTPLAQTPDGIVRICDFDVTNYIKSLL